MNLIELDVHCQMSNKVIGIKRGHLVSINDKDDYEVGQNASI